MSGSSKEVISKHLNWKHYLSVPDLGFFIAIVLLSGLGLVMVYSSTSIMAVDHFGDSLYHLKRQSLFLFLGFFSMLILSKTDYRLILQKSRWILIGILVLLVMTYIPGLGVKAGGAQRWLRLGNFQLQPGEFTKIALVSYLAFLIPRKQAYINDFQRSLLPILGILSILGFLLLKQPDFGNAVILFLLAGILLFSSGLQLRWFLGAGLLAIPMAAALIFGASYRKQRLLTFLDPFQDPKDSGYQIVQSFTAFFSGGFWGTGLGNGREKLYFLPKVHTDFIGALLSEELGFLGMALLVGCFIVILYRGFTIARAARETSGYLLAIGASSLIGLQAFLNLAVITGLLPTKGLPLPFLSHGGSALIVMFLSAGLVLSVAERSLPVNYKVKK